MTAELSNQAISKRFKLSPSLAVEITVGALGFVVEWLPGPPESLSKKETIRYVAARREMLAQLAELIGGDIMVLDAEHSGTLNLSEVIASENEHTE